MSPLAALTDVEVDYGGRRALGPFSLALQPGEIVALVGPSGCGKSTALRLLAGLEQPTRGAVARTPGRGETAVVFQAPTLMPWAGAAANVALPLELAGVGKSEARERAKAALVRVGLAEATALKPAQLSGGMAMRVSLARALVTEPRLLLLDEPFAALDEITRRSLADDVLKLWSETRPAIVFVTHSVEEAVYMASRGGGDERGARSHRRRDRYRRPPPPPAGFSHHRGVSRGRRARLRHASQRHGGARRMNRIAPFLAPWVLIGAILAIWQIACRLTHIPTFLLPSPSDIGAALAVGWPALLQAALNTLVMSLEAWVVALVWWRRSSPWARPSALWRSAPSPLSRRPCR